jgi:hypothetical protein
MRIKALSPVVRTYNLASIDALWTSMEIEVWHEWLFSTQIIHDDIPSIIKGFRIIVA